MRPKLGIIAMMPFDSRVRADAKFDIAAPEARVFTAADGATMPYLLLKPRSYNPSRAYPVVMFYHGAGERGDDGKQHWKNGVEAFQKSACREEFPCFVVAPQCPLERQWVNLPWADDAGAQPAAPSEELKLSLHILSATQRQFSVDDKRFYAVGLSMGAFATWDLITRYPELFAAAVPICGGGDEQVAAKAKDVPIWAFHGADDMVVKALRSRNMIAAIERAGGNPKYTEYPGIGHESWVAAFDEPNLLPWLFAQHIQS